MAGPTACVQGCVILAAGRDAHALPATFVPERKGDGVPAAPSAMVDTENDTVLRGQLGFVMSPRLCYHS